MSAASPAAQPGSENPFLDPILARLRACPEKLVGMFHDGDDWHALDTGAFMARAQQFAGLFASGGVAAGDIVLIILEHSIDAHAAFIGAMLIGAVPGFMPSPSVKQDAVLYWRTHRDVFAHARPRAILVYDSLLDAVTQAADGTGAAVIALSRVETTAPAPPGPVPPAGAVALLQHSSGTTGLKKGVQLSYQAIADQLVAYRVALALDDVAAPRFASWLPLYHDMGLISSFLLPLWLGAPILSIDPFEWTRQPALLFEAVQSYRATHAWMPNFALLHHVRTARAGNSWDLSSLAAIICCSEPNKPEAFDAFTSHFAGSGVAAATLQASYAMAETVFAVTQTRLGAPVRRLAVDRAALQTNAIVAAPRPGQQETVLLSNGPPIAGCEVRILRDDTFVGERSVGEVCIRAPYLFSGYHNNPAASEKAFFGPWLRSGDLGFLDQGEVFIVGRLKDVIIVNGKNILAHDVEAAVSRVPQVKPGRAVAFGQYMPALGSEQLVIVAERLDAHADSADILRRINQAVAQEVGVVCGDVRVVDQGWLVKTTSGKMSRAENERKYVATFIEAAPAG
jgi:acyl-CoA synthetase (AMP-forming)/AMP-acid ligase II